MKIIKSFVLLAFTIVTSLPAQNAPVIVSFSQNGELVCTNLEPGSVASVEWSSSLSGPWQNNWTGLDAVTVASNGTIQVSVPMFYRVRGVVAIPAGMVSIPAGSFTMGSPASEAGRRFDEVQHIVTLTAGFYMGKYEVTQGQYLEVVGNNPSHFSGDTDRPVETVSWNDAMNYCALLTQADRLAGRIPTNWVYRLPTESEWEYACRGGATTAFHYGSVIHGGMANFYSYVEYNAAIGDIYVGIPVGYLGQTTTVGSYAPNAFGLYDMHGNVWEWCQDWYGEYPSGAVADPTGPASGSTHVSRGGSWDDYGRSCRSAIRYGYEPLGSYDARGFRVVLSPG